MPPGVGSPRMSVAVLNVPPVGSRGAIQLSFADVGSPVTPDELSLRDTTFVIVDLETTGGRTKSTAGARPDAITEIGAVKVRGGVVLGEFATLVDPQRSIPPQIVQLTGITTAMVFVMVLIMSIFFLLVDMLLGGVINAILGLGS